MTDATAVEALVNRLFSVGDVVKSGGGRTSFQITEILADRVRIKPTNPKRKTKSRLSYSKLAVVLDNFDDIDGSHIEKSVGALLLRHQMLDTQNESYLYGFARECLKRLKGYEDRLEKQVSAAIKDTQAERLKRLAAAPRIPPRVPGTTQGFLRNPDVIAEALARADGHCRECGNPAPFIRKANNTPYLEVHHRIHLAQGGEDTIDNAIALCPNCHRKAHFG